MSDASNHDLRTASKAFHKSRGYKMAMLLPHRDAVLELRAKGASLALIARLLENIGVHVSIDTIRRLCLREPEHSPQITAPATRELPKQVDLPATLRRDIPQPTLLRGPRIADPNSQ
ncbi:MAG: hypothetical protein ORN83_07045 [Chthoniobacteraceae bacterium]|nr:hypothetical protein [Chthoniobacteraceae bacterium]